MSVFMTDTAEKKVKIEGASHALVRIAIPSFKIGWRKSKPKKTANGPTIEEFQSLFHEDFRRSSKLKIKLTDEERQEYNQVIDLRKALYGPKSH